MLGMCERGRWWRRGSHKYVRTRVTKQWELMPILPAIQCVDKDCRRFHNRSRVPKWWNGRHARLRGVWGFPHAGSSPAFGTNILPIAYTSLRQVSNHRFGETLLSRNRLESMAVERQICHQLLYLGVFFTQLPKLPDFTQPQANPLWSFHVFVDKFVKSDQGCYGFLELLHCEDL